MARKITTDTPEGKAVTKYIRSSPMKVRRAADLVRRKPVSEARRLLAFSPLRGSRLLSKTLESAVANATNNFHLYEDRLYVHATYVDEGPTINRWKPAAYGRAYRIRKRTAHITVIVRAAEES